MIGGGMLAFLLTEALAVFSVSRRGISFFDSVGTPREIIASWLAFLMLFFSLLVLFKYFRDRDLFGFFFFLSLLFGLNFLFSLYFSPIVALPLSLALLLGKALGRRVFIQNLALIPGLAGISIAVGESLGQNTAMALLIVLSFYDIIAVYFTKHMVVLFRGLLSHGVIPAIIIPESFSGFLKRTYEISPGSGFMLLGTGDIILPAVFAVAVSPLGYAAVLGAVAGSLLGFVATETIFTHQRFRRPMPALPPIATGTILGFFIVRMLL